MNGTPSSASLGSAKTLHTDAEMKMLWPCSSPLTEERASSVVREAGIEHRERCEMPTWDKGSGRGGLLGAVEEEPLETESPGVVTMTRRKVLYWWWWWWWFESLPEQVLAVLSVI
jgi:hypothetical protein